MTHHSDGLRIGAAGVSPLDNRPIPDQQGVPAPQYGVPTSQQFIYDVVPLTLQTNNIMTAATLSGAPATATLTAGTGVTTTTTRSGASVLAFDVARCVSITGTSTFVTAASFTISGFDDYQQPMTQTLTGPASTNTVTTTKAFRYIRSITASGNTASNVTVGSSDTLGLPIRVNAFEYLNIRYNSGVPTLSTGFTAAVTTTATATTGDVRGTYALQTASNGSRRFVAAIFIKDPDTVTGAFGVQQA